MTYDDFDAKIRPCLVDLWPHAYRQAGEDTWKVWFGVLRLFEPKAALEALRRVKAEQTANRAPTPAQVRQLCMDATPGAGDRVYGDWVNVQRKRLEKSGDPAYDPSMTDDQIRDMVAEQIRAHGYPVRLVRGVPVPCPPEPDEETGRQNATLKKQLAELYDALPRAEQKRFVRQVWRKGSKGEPIDMGELHGELLGAYSKETDDGDGADIPF